MAPLVDESIPQVRFRPLAAPLAAWSRIPAFWRVQLVFWAFIFIFALLSRWLLTQSFGRALAFSLVMEPLALLVSGGLRSAYRRLGLTELAGPRTIAWTLLLCSLAALVQVAAVAVLRGLTGWEVPNVGGLHGPLIPFTFYVPIFLGWSFGYFWLTAERRATDAEVDLLKAEVQRLRGQLDPHLLFNALNGIAAEIPDQPDAARRMVDELADYLRYCLDHRDHAITTLAAELEGLEAYLAIDRARLGPELRFAAVADAVARGRMLPSLLLQPLVENAIKHGRRQGLTPAIEVRAAVEEDWLHLKVLNAGRLAPDWEARIEGQGRAGGGHAGVGLANIRQRLALHYPGRHRFALRQEGERVLAEISLLGEPAGA